MYTLNLSTAVTSKREHSYEFNFQPISCHVCSLLMCLFSLLIETLAAVSVARLRAYRLRKQSVISAKCKQSREREDTHRLLRLLHGVHVRFLFVIYL